MQSTRAPHHIGKFGEALVSYALIRRGFEVATVDHVGADLIAERDGQRFAISVKARLFKEGSIESKMLVIEEAGLKRLYDFADHFELIPLIACAIALADEKTIHLFMTSADHVRKNFKPCQHGFSLYFSDSKIGRHKDDPEIAYTCWHEPSLENFERIQAAGNQFSEGTPQ